MLRPAGFGYERIESFPQGPLPRGIPGVAREIDSFLGIDCEIVDDDYQLLVDNHPTIKAYLAGDIRLSEALFIEAYLSNGFNAAKAASTAKYRAFSSGGGTSSRFNEALSC